MVVSALSILFLSISVINNAFVIPKVSKIQLNSLTSINTKLSLIDNVDDILQNLSDKEKYELLIQSYSTQLLENSSSSNKIDEDKEKINSMLSLFDEMIAKKLKPSNRATSNLLNAVALQCSSQLVGITLTMIKASGMLTVFGGFVSQLYDPFDNFPSTFELLPKKSIPKDDRESEIFYASLAIMLVVICTGSQIASIINSDLKSYSTIASGILIFIGSLEVALNESKGLKKAASGFDRLVLKDEERENYCESSAFVAGYLLGLPSFCYLPDVTESLRMIDNIYKKDDKKDSSDSVGSSSSSSSSSTSNSDSMSSNFNNSNNYGLSIFQTNVDYQEEDYGLLLSRILVWLLVPAAAENIRYDSTIVSDPRQASRLLETIFQKTVTSNDSSSNGSSSSSDADVEAIKEKFTTLTSLQQKELIDWAYFEASAFVRTYADLIEDVRDFLLSGTSSVAEIVILIEREVGGDN